MTACPKCGYSPDAPVVSSWTFVVPREIKSLNRRITNTRGTGWEYRADRIGWHRDLLALRRVERIPIADGMRRVTLTRIFSGRQREMDRDNLVGGAKSCVDALVSAGLLVDDSPRSAEIHYGQERGAKPGLSVLLEELGSEQPDSAGSRSGR